MRPFSFTTYLLRAIWNGVPIGLWLALGGAAFLLVRKYIGIADELNAPIIAFAMWLVARLLRPVRKFFSMMAYSGMLLSPIHTLVELGTWQLLLVSDKYWSNELPEYQGMEAFTKAYRRRSAEWQLKINRILWRADAAGRPHVAKPSREFLREVGAPLREDWQ
jgi:hypothetical protein